MVASDSVSANWKDGTKSKYLLRQLQKQADRGKRAGNNFKKEAWTAALANFNTKFGVQYSLSQVKTHFESVSSTCGGKSGVADRVAKLKTKFGHFRSLLDMSGFGWDDNLKVATAPDDVWEKLLAAQHDEKKRKNYASWRDRPFPLYEPLLELLDGAMATGEDAMEIGEVLRSAPVDSGKPAAKSQSGDISSKSSSDTGSSVSSARPVLGPAPDEVESGNPSGADSISSPNKKKRKVKSGSEDTPGRGKSAGQIMANAFARYVDQISKGPEREDSNPFPSFVNQAVHVLLEEYKYLLSDEEIAVAVDVVTNPVKASLLLTMQPGGARDAWVRRQVALHQ